MRHTMMLFQIGLRQIIKDGMLLIMIPTPILAGIFFRFAIPALNDILMDQFSFSIVPWYGLIDGMLLCLAPMFVAILTAFLLLDEHDEGVASFFQISPAAGFPYLIARIGIPMIWAFFMTIFVSVIFHISAISFMQILLCSMISCLTGIFLAMMVVALAGNRVEGIAYSKLMGLSFLGLIVQWFLPAPYYYAFSFLPSYWIGKLLVDGVDIFTFLLGMGVSILWILVFTRRFLRKV